MRRFHPVIYRACALRMHFVLANAHFTLVFTELRGTKRSLCLYVFQSLKFITSASTNFDLHSAVSICSGCHWSCSTTLRLALAYVYLLHCTEHRISAVTSHKSWTYVDLGWFWWVGVRHSEVAKMFLMLPVCSWCYALNATLSTFSWMLRSQLSQVNSTYFKHTLHPKLWTLSSNSQHALDATLLTLSSTFQHALCATVFTFSSNFNKNYINSLQCILKIFRQFQTSSDTFEQDNVGTQCAGGKLLQI